MLSEFKSIKNFVFYSSSFDASASTSGAASSATSSTAGVAAAILAR
ncbi:hypothetical protein JCM19274_4170 [Algibacter lectus]|uniref:Uncharacterized protein n=1 Tax=Algibacter lectus TaxID=221126 RepID=A0A090WPR0_9FLAO|nr:hypothetical protein JCM19274_4170 [Algibacter lectus]